MKHRLQMAVSICVLSLVPGCMTTQSVTSIEELENVAANDDVPVLNKVFFSQLIDESYARPLVVAVTSDDCRICEKAVGELWRLRRKNRSKFLLATIPRDQVPEGRFATVDNKHLPHFLVYRNGLLLNANYGVRGFLKTRDLLTKLEVIKYPIRKTKKQNLNGDARFFLIAGGTDTAAFAEEAISQKKFLLSSGVPEKEIACYVALPDLEEYLADKEHFDRLIGDMEHCATTRLPALRKSIARSAKKLPDDASFYVYATAHGNSGKNIKERLESSRVPNKERRDESCKTMFDAYLAISKPMGYVAHLDAYWRESCSRGGKQDAVFNSSYLTDVLRPLGSRFKAVVLQGCYSGGFIEDNRYRKQKNDLRGLSNLTALTASRGDRVSFGCAPGHHMTDYGASFFEALKGSFARDVSKMNWQRLHVEASKRVKEKETRQKISKGSLPQIYESR